jgi:hypothetical protein
MTTGGITCSGEMLTMEIVKVTHETVDKSNFIILIELHKVMLSIYKP